MPAVTLPSDCTLVVVVLELAVPELVNTVFRSSPVMPLPPVPRPLRLVQTSLVRPLESISALPKLSVGLSATGLMSTFMVTSLPRLVPSFGLYLNCA
ncbi:hypothetical protein D3C76_980540 [compost metagenome]